MANIGLGALRGQLERIAAVGVRARRRWRLRGRGGPFADGDLICIRGYVSAAAKHGICALAAVRDALAGSLWMTSLPEFG